MKKLLSVLLFFTLAFCLFGCNQGAKTDSVNEKNDKVKAVITELSDAGVKGLTKSEESDRSMWHSIKYNCDGESSIEFDMSLSSGNFLRLVISGSDNDSYKALCNAALNCKSLGFPEGFYDAVGSMGGNGVFGDCSFEASQNTDGSLELTVNWLSEMMG